MDREMRELAERVARLETMADQGNSDRRDIKESIEELKDCISEMTTEFSRYKGFLGGVVMVVGMVCTFLSFIGGYLYDFFVNKGGPAG